MCPAVVSTRLFVAFIPHIKYVTEDSNKNAIKTCVNHMFSRVFAKQFFKAVVISVGSEMRTNC